VPRMILVSGSANALTYNLSGLQSFNVEAVNATIDTTGMAPATLTQCDVIFKDPTGLVFARCRSSNTLQNGVTVTITFAPHLPDTQELGNLFIGNVSTTGLCDTILPPLGSVTVQPVDPLAVVKGFRMWVEDVNLGGDQNFTGDLQLGRYLLVPGLVA